MTSSNDWQSTRVVAPIYLKFTVRYSSGLYPSGTHIQGVAESTTREHVHRASIGYSVLTRYGFEKQMPDLLIFGSTGTLGGAIIDKYRSENWDMTCAVRKVVHDCDVQLPFTNEALPKGLENKQFDSVVFAQGANINGSAMQTGTYELTELFGANVVVIAESIAALMAHNAISEGGRVVILSSLWEQFTRQEKFAYSVTKAAVGGLVRSLAVDLGRQKKILVNGILPGIVNSPMVARTLSPEQVASIAEQTPGGELSTPVDVANSVYMFGSALNTGISGQSIFVDRGFSIARTI